MGAATGPVVLITGAAGNLGSLLARHLVQTGQPLRLMYHRTPLAADLLSAPNVRAVQADLAKPETLKPAVEGADVVMHFAGRLFAPRPERFLPETNTRWFSNLVTAAIAANVSRVILASFPHVEGPSSVERPATGRLDREPISVHARTRLEEEQIVVRADASVRDDTGRAEAGHDLRPRHPDGGRGPLAREAPAALCLEGADVVPPAVHGRFSARDRGGNRQSRRAGIYHVGDERPVSLQEFLDAACRVWGCPRPRRIPFPLVYAAAWLCEQAATVARTPSPLTRDFVRLGRVPHWGDTTRARQELVPELIYPTLESGLSDALNHVTT